MAHIDEESFHDRHRESLGRRLGRNKARREIEEIRNAVTRGIGESRLLSESIWMLRARAGFYAATGREPAARPAARTSPTSDASVSARYWQTLRSTASRPGVQELARLGRTREAIANLMSDQQASLEACFGPQAMSSLTEIGQKYRSAADILADRDMLISRRAGDRPPDLREDDPDVVAEAPGSSSLATRGYAIDIYDPFFSNEDSPRSRLLRTAGHSSDLELLHAGILVHEAIHWVVRSGGHRRLGNLSNPQNYEFYLILHYTNQPPSYTQLGNYRRD